MSLLTYGLMIEGVQAFLPTRFASIEDVIADSVGVVIGILILRAVKRVRP